VRELEQRVRERNSDTPYAPPTKQARPVVETQPSAVLRAIEDDLRRFLQTDVRVNSAGDGKGRIEIAFYSADDLERVLELVLRDLRREY
jgi:ParB family chromosome partitioning protein